MTKLNEIQWNVFDIQAINNVNDLHLPVVTMNLKYDDRIVDQSKSISFSLDAEQFAVLFAGFFSHFSFSIRKNHRNSSSFFPDLQTARDLIKTYSKS